MKKVAVTCRRCGAPFERWPSAAQTETLFCSIRCHNMFQASERLTHSAERFWSKVAIGEPGECWPWTAYKNRAGYGQSAWKGKLRLAHRIALSLTDGDWESRLHVCHSCDFPACCNPAHLWRGTDRDNVHDMFRKGRARHNPLRGERNPNAKLSAEQVAAIRGSLASAATLAASHGVSVSYINALRSAASSKTWSAIPIISRPLKTHCRNGHEYTGRLDKRGARICSLCHARNNAAYLSRRNERHTP